MGGDGGGWLPVEDPHEGLKKGKLLFELRGYKLHGKWTLVKLKKGEKEWLLIKEKDAYVADDGALPPQSVLSGLTVEELKAGGRPPGPPPPRPARLPTPRPPGRPPAGAAALPPAPPPPAPQGRGGCWS